MTDEIQTRVRGSAEQIVRDCLALNPVVILGSGASAGLGLPTMAQLADRIVENAAKEKLSTEDTAKWALLFDALMTKEGLEPALDKAGLDEDSPLFRSIVATVWKAITWKDLAVFEEMRAGRMLPHTRLFTYLFGGSARRVTVVTPNYDRLIEYGADQGGFCHQTGFTGIYSRRWEGLAHAPRFFRTDTRQEERTVDVLKVHGSIDWFRGGDGDPVGLPVHALTEDGLQVPAGMQPVIVPPTKEKYRQSQFDPYRSLMGQADDALKSAAAFLCIGYGFNDVHVQLYLTRALRDRPKPLVMVAHSLTPKAQEALKQASQALRYCVFTAGEPGTTEVRTHEHPAGVALEGIDAWSFDGFAAEFL
ncbi:MAG: SIR2 family protein [Actinomycetota bacterium]